MDAFILDTVHEMCKHKACFHKNVGLFHIMLLWKLLVMMCCNILMSCYHSSLSTPNKYVCIFHKSLIWKIMFF